MMHKYTPEDLLQYLYKETSVEATTLIDEALKTDWTLREKLVVLKASGERLNTVIETPRTEVVLNVLKYAAKKETLQH